MTLPSKWAIFDIAWGEERKHLCCPDTESLEFYATEREAREAAQSEIEGGAKMVAVLEIKALFAAKAVEYEELE